VTLQPGGFFLVWADNQPGQGPAHTIYKLDAAGEEVGLFDAASTGYFLLDSLSFGPQIANISIGRQTDGGLPWVNFNESTPGYSNTANNLPEEIIHRHDLLIYPNPVRDGMIYFREPFTGRITDTVGRTVWNGREAVKADVSHFPAGIYLIVDSRGNRAKMMIP